jgi:hypothetical protein
MRRSLRQLKAGEFTLDGGSSNSQVVGILKAVVKRAQVAADINFAVPIGNSFCDLIVALRHSVPVATSPNLAASSAISRSERTLAEAGAGFPANQFVWQGPNGLCINRVANRVSNNSKYRVRPPRPL